MNQGIKLLAVSDTHGRFDRLLEAVSRHRNADTVLFLGDGLRDLSALPPDVSAKICAVRGNCDVFSIGGDGDVPNERFLCFGNYHILMMHGHTHGVKADDSRAVAYAARRGADVLLYGHTHTATERYLPEGSIADGIVLSKPMYVMNPGSLGSPRDGNPSYGLLDLCVGGIVTSIGRL